MTTNNSKKTEVEVFSKFTVENFSVVPDDDFICSVCHNVFDDPKECPCGHLFCNKCIDSWLKRKQTCPICRIKVTRYGLKNVTYVLRNIINKLKLNCPNKKNGCELQPTLDKIDEHLTECDFARVRCQNAKCPCKELLRKDIKRHEIYCAYKLVLCTKGCNFQIPKLEMRHHNCIDALLKELKELRSSNTQMKYRIDELERQLQSRRNSESQRDSARTNRRGVLSWLFESDNNGLTSDDTFSSDFSSSDSSYGGNPSSIEPPSFMYDSFDDHFDSDSDHVSLMDSPSVNLIRVPITISNPSATTIQSSVDILNRDSSNARSNASDVRFTRSQARSQPAATLQQAGNTQPPVSTLNPTVQLPGYRAILNMHMQQRFADSQPASQQTSNVSSVGASSTTTSQSTTSPNPDKKPVTRRGNKTANPRAGCSSSAAPNAHQGTSTGNASSTAGSKPSCSKKRPASEVESNSAKRMGRPKRQATRRSARSCTDK